MMSFVPSLVMVAEHLGKVVPLLCEVTVSPFVVDKYLVRSYFETMQNSFYLPSFLLLV